jgi:membrane protease YdiL (CAAX protease family)
MIRWDRVPANPPEDWITVEPPPRIPSVLQAGAIWVTAALAMLAAGVGVAATAAAFANERGASAAQLLSDPLHSPLLTSPIWIAVGTAANELAVLLVLVGWCVALRPTPKLAFPLARTTPLAIIGALLVVFGLTPLAEVFAMVADRWFGSEITATRIITQAAKRAGPAELALLLVSVAVLPAIVEEGMFRGLLTASFARHSRLAALIIPSLLFGIIHIEPTQVAATTVLGIGFALTRLYTGSLVPCVIAHGVYNAAVVIAVRSSEAALDETRAISAIPLLVGSALVVAGIYLLRRSGGSPFSSRATAEHRVPPPA